MDFEKYAFYIIAIAILLICGIPVLNDYLFNTVPYSYFKTDMLVVEEKEGCIGNVGEIVDGVKITQNFYSNYDSVSDISFKLDPLSSDGSGFLNIRIVDLTTKEIVYEWHREIMDVINDSTVVFELDNPFKRFDMRDRLYSIEISPEGIFPSNAVSLLCSTEDFYQDGELYINDVSQGGDLLMVISGYDGIETYERIRVWLFITIAFLLEALLFWVRRKLLESDYYRKQKKYM